MDVTASSVAGFDGKANSDSDVARRSLAEDFDNFLTLLTTQLQNQDPLDPMDSTEFTNQLVHFSNLEQQIAQNEKLEDMLGVVQTSINQAALGYIGLDIEMDGSNFAFEGDTLEFGYTLEQNASQVEINILNDSGNVVRRLTGPVEQGSHRVAWDGLDDSGNPAAPGNYQLLVGAADKEGAAFTVPTTVPARVTGVETTGDSVLLETASGMVPLEAVNVARWPSGVTGA